MLQKNFLSIKEKQTNEKAINENRKKKFFYAEFRQKAIQGKKSLYK